MLAKSDKNILLLLILLLAFSYRFILLTWNIYPPGADIGLHESVIKSITVGKTGFFRNFYHMGGGVSATNPGYHIFVVTIIAMTGAPDLFAQTIVASFFSALVVLCAFLFVKIAWSESTSFIVAFLVAFSGGDIAILIWGGYPNVITLFLIPAVFYLFLQRSKISSSIYLAMGSLMVGALFLTHVFSALVFVAITLVTLLVAAIFPRRTGISRSRAASGLLPIFFGALSVSPYLFGIVPVYFGTEGAIINATSAMKQAVLETGLVSMNVVYLSLIPVILFFLLSRLYKGRFVTVQAILSAVWVIVPALMTQSYLLGVHLVYERFLYFLFLPVITCVALLTDLGSRVFSSILGGWVSRIRKRGFGMRACCSKPESARDSTGRIISSVFVFVLLLFSIFTVPLFTAPNAGIAETNSYQAMTPAGYEALEWIGTNTPPGSVWVADAYFGWWVSGFAQRPTLSAADPQYLILAHEFEPARVAANVLESNYFIDNGLIQVKQDASNVEDNYEFSAWLNGSYVPYRFFSFRESEADFVYRNNNTPLHASFAQVPDGNMSVENDLNSASFLVSRENSLFILTEEITLHSGTRFAKVSITLQTDKKEVSFDWLHFYFQQRGSPIQYGDSIAAIDTNMQVLSQIVLPEGTLGKTVLMRENPNSYELVYNLEGKSTVQVQFFVGLSQYQAYDANIQANYPQDLVFNNTKTYLSKVSDLPLTFFDYKAAIQEWNLSYIIARSDESVLRLTKDTFFSLVFRNNELAIFKVKHNST
jgi:hypothetical protein